MKRLICFVLLLTLVGCSDQTLKLDSKNPVHLTIWHYYYGPQQQAFDKMVNEFNSTLGLEKGIVVEASSYGGVTELADAVLAAANNDISSKPMPDVFAAYSNDAIVLYDMGKLAHISDYMSEEELNKYVPAFIDEGRMGADNKPVIFPIAKSSEIGMLNKTDFDIFAKDVSGVSYEDLKTFEGIERVAEKYYKWTDEQTPDIENDGKAFFGVDVVANLVNILAKQMSKEIVAVSNGEAEVGYDKQTMRKIWDIYHNNMVRGYFTAKGRFRSDDAKTGDLLYLVGATTGVAYFPTEVTDKFGNSHEVSMEAILMPTVEGGEKVAVQQGAGMCVSKSTKEREYAACLFLKWFTDKSRNIDFSMDSYGYMSVVKSEDARDLTIAAIDEIRSSTDISAEAEVNFNTALVMEKFLEQSETYELYVQKPFKNSSELRNILNDIGKSTQEAVQMAREEIAAGSDYEQVVNKYCSEEAFELWYGELDKSIRNLLYE